jgi:uncharacterized protein YlxW (UPF0749 family)
MLCGHGQACIVFGGQQERIGKLENGLVRVELTVQQLAGVVSSEHTANQEIRRQDREELKEHVNKMDRSVTGLTEEIKKIAERTSAVDSSVLAKQSQASGAVDAAKWIAGTLVTVLGLVLTYQAGQRGTHYTPEPPVPQYSERAK